MNPSARQILNIQRGTPSFPFDRSPAATSQVQYQDATEKSNDALRHVFDEHMEKAGHCMTPSFYRNVKCLLISWDDERDDLHTGPEVAALANVLEKKMHFKVTKALLSNDANHGAHLQVVHHIINFLWAEDGPETLLLFYYAGHGIPKSRHDGLHGLHLTGKRTRPEDADDMDDVVWAHIEDNIQHTKADVLEIFDCCYAGDLSETRHGWGTRSFEFLGACSSGNKTRSPGDESFTTALIWAFEALLKDQKRFTLTQLSRKIREAPHFPKHQVPVQLDRAFNSIERIVLAPLPKSDENTESTPNRSNETNDDQGHLTLNFVFDKSPSEKMIGQFADALNRAMRKNQIPVKRIGWGGFQPTRTAYQAAAKIFHEALGRKRTRRNGGKNLEVPTPSPSDGQPSYLSTPDSQPRRHERVEES